MVQGWLTGRTPRRAPKPPRDENRHERTSWVLTLATRWVRLVFMTTTTHTATETTIRSAGATYRLRVTHSDLHVTCYDDVAGHYPTTIPVPLSVRRIAIGRALSVASWRPAVTRLGDEASSVGDAELVRICERAMCGSVTALRRALRIIAEAQSA